MDRKNTQTSNQAIKIIIVVGILGLMLAALIIDGEMGERVFVMLMSGMALVLGYFFKHATIKN